MAAHETEGGDLAATNAERVATTLRREILDGGLEPGARLRAEAFAERFDLSRSPVREAFMILATEGLLEILPRRGAVVRSFDERDVYELYEVRALLEPLAAKRASLRISEEDLTRLDELASQQEGLGGSESDIAGHLALNDQFHTLIIDAANSHRLTAALSQVQGLPVSFRTGFWSDDNHRRESLECHRMILGALRNRHADYAETIMRMHLQAAMVLFDDYSRPPG